MTWDEEDDDGTDLFEELDNLEVEIEEEKEVLSTIKAEEKTPENKKPKKEEEEEEEEEDLFSAVEEEEDDEDEEDSNEKDKLQNSTSKVAMVSLLKEKGVLKFELDEGQELDETLAEELIEEGFEEAAETAAEEKLKSLPEEFQNVIKFGLKGGSLQEYYDTLADTYGGAGTVFTESMDLEDDDTLEKIARTILEDDYDSEDDLEAHINLLKDRGSLKSFATKHYNAWLDEKKETEKKLITNQAARKKEIEEELKTKKNVLSTVLEKEDLTITPSKDDFKELGSYLYDKTVKLANGGAITEFQKTILIDMASNPKAMAQLAILTRNLNEDGTINFKALDLKSESQIVKGIREGINPDKRSSTRQRKSIKGKSLADIISPK